jgi:hypothetical protein
MAHALTMQQLNPAAAAGCYYPGHRSALLPAPATTANNMLPISSKHLLRSLLGIIGNLQQAPPAQLAPYPKNANTTA